MIDFMNKTRDIFYKERRKLLFGFSAYNKLGKPTWMLTGNDHRFEATYKDQKILFKKGRIVFANIVQANTLLFKPGNFDSPAAMVYSEDSYFEQEPEKLRIIAHDLFAIKGKIVDDEELQGFSDILADEMVPLFNVQIPEKIAYGKKVYFTTFMVHRNHLPKGYIDFGPFPALICPEKTEASIILPSRYWETEWSKRKKVKILNVRKLKRLFDDDPEKYVEVIQDHIDYASDKIRDSKSEKDKWKTRITYYRYQKTTALIYCGRHQEAKELLEEILSRIDISTAQDLGSVYYIIVIGNLVTALIYLERFEEAKQYIVLIEKTLPNCKDKTQIELLNKHLQLKQIELDLFQGDIERGGSSLKSLLESNNNNKITLGSIYMNFGIYHYKRNEKDKALDYFNKASEIIKAPYYLKKIQSFYKN